MNTFCTAKGIEFGLTYVIGFCPPNPVEVVPVCNLDEMACLSVCILEETARFSVCNL